MPRLCIRNPSGEEHETVLSGPIYMGRHKDCEVILADPKVSRRHTRFIPVGRSYIVEDLGSANGTFLNGQRIERRVLSNGDLVEIGPFRIRYIGEPGEDLVGQVIEGYRVLRRIGMGGMGSVYLAEQVSMGRMVALKILNDELADDPEFIEDFMNEARLAGKLGHPNIVRVYDFGPLGKTYFISMEYVDGKPVRELLEERGRLEPGEAVRIMTRVAEGLEHAHSNGVIHQDIKPQNIMLSANDEVKLADLGLARRAGSGPDERHKKAIIATPHYMSPEQGKRLPPDARSDIYSFGATLFHLVTGRVPFDGPNSLAIITKHLHQEPPNPKQFDMTLPDSLCEFILKCLQKEPDNRCQTASQLREALEDISRDLAAHKRKRAQRRKAASHAISRKEPLSGRYRRAGTDSMNLLYILLGVSAVFLVGVYLAVTTLSGGRPRRSADRKTGQTLLDARIALEDGARTTAFRLASEALEQTSEPSYVREAKSIIEEVRRSIEEEADRQFILLQELHQRDPELARPHLRELITRYPGTRAAAKASEMLGKQPEQAETSGPVIDTSAPEREEIDDVIEQARDAATRGHFVKAVGLLERAAAKASEQDRERVESQLRTIRSAASLRTEEYLSAATTALEEGNLPRVASAIRSAERCAISEQELRSLQELRSSLKTRRTERLAEVEKEMAGMLSSFRFDAASKKAAAAAGELGDDAADKINRMGRLAALASAGFQALIEAVNLSPGRAFEAAIQGNEPAWLEALWADSRAVKVRFRNSERSLTLEWPELPPDGLTTLVFAYGARIEAGEAAALLTVRGRKQAALQLLKEDDSPAAELVRSFARRQNGRGKVLEFNNISALTAWSTTEGRWTLENGRLAEKSGGESSLSYNQDLTPGVMGALRVTVHIHSEGPEGFVSASLKSNGTEAVLYLDEEGSRFRLRAPGIQKAYRIEKPRSEGTHRFTIDISRQGISGSIDDASFPAARVFGAGAGRFTLTIAGAGEPYAVTRVEIEQK